MADPSWAPFLAVVAVLTLAVLGLARQSQGLLKEHAPDDGSDEDDAVEVPETEPSSAESAERNTEPVQAGDTETGPEFELTTGMLLANVAVTQGIVALVVVVAAWYFAIPAEALAIDPAGNALFPAIGLGAAFGVVLWVGNELSTALADAVGAAYDEAVRQLLAPDSAGSWAVLLGVVLPIIAVSEELLFRAALIGVPAAGYGVSPWLLAVVASAAFALGHGAQGRVGVVVTGALGFVLAAGYVVSGSLLLVVIAHYVINALEFLVHEGLGIDDISVGRRVLDA
ncbi:CPBP family intramembrane metalloprotease [Halobacteriales archaeon QS_4_66_20]|nr:MAG: CPBP family intramembrane metalloprotease [Halobacteriales archaeon QS_4_66_20]